MAALIGALRVSLSADTAQFEAGMRRAQGTATNAATGIQRTLGGLKGAVAGFVSALSVGMFVNVIKNALEYAGSLGEVSQQLGVTTRDLQVFRFAAGQVGVSNEALETGLSKLTITLGRVAAGAKQPIDALKAIGVTADELKGKDAGEAFRIIADGLEKITDRSQRAAIEVALFGKSGAQLDNLLSGGSGALNNLANAAERLGIVLSDEQIQRADDTADKLAAMKTVISANIAGAVADNADAILTLADSLAMLVRSIGDAMRGWRILMAELKAGANALSGIPVGQFRNPITAMQAAGNAVRAEDRFSSLFRGRPRAPAGQAVAGSGISQFLASPGPKPKRPRAAREDHSAENALRDQHQFDSEMARAQQDILRAQQSLSADYNERAAISLQMIDADKAIYDADLQYQVALNKLSKGQDGMTQAQADQLRAANDQKVALDKQAVANDVLAQRYQDKVRLEQADYDIKRDQLQAESQLADTASEQRDAALRMLDLTYRQERARLKAVLADEQASVAAKDEAQARLNAMEDRYNADRAGIIKGTRGPLEQWAASVPQTAAQINEAFQSIQAQGLEGLSDAISDVITGTRSLKEAFGDLAKSILADIIKMTVKMLIFRAVSSAIGGFGGGGAGGMSFDQAMSGNAFSFNVPGFATGGSMRLGGVGGIDTNMLSANGIPIARYTAGERINISNDNVNSGGAREVIINNHFEGNLLTPEFWDRINAGDARAAQLGSAMGVRQMQEINRRR